MLEFGLPAGLLRVDARRRHIVGSAAVAIGGGLSSELVVPVVQTSREIDHLDRPRRLVARVGNDGFDRWACGDPSPRWRDGAGGANRPSCDGIRSAAVARWCDGARNATRPRLGAQTGCSARPRSFDRGDVEPAQGVDEIREPRPFQAVLPAVLESRDDGLVDDALRLEVPLRPPKRQAPASDHRADQIEAPLLLRVSRPRVPRHTTTVSWSAYRRRIDGFAADHRPTDSRGLCRLRASRLRVSPGGPNSSIKQWECASMGGEHRGASARGRARVSERGGASEQRLRRLPASNEGGRRPERHSPISVVASG
jgi:hypothetical protein